MLENSYFLAGNAAGLQSPTYLGTATGQTGGIEYMAKLGDFQFALDTAAFQTLARTTEFRWVLLQRIGRAPAAQFLGPGEDSLELTGIIYPHFRGGLGQIGLIREKALTGEPMSLVYAFERRGQYAGQWCVKSVKETRTEFFQDGKPRKIEFIISLTAYGDDFGTTQDGSAGTGNTLLDLFAGLGGALSASGIFDMPDISDDAAITQAADQIAQWVSNTAPALSAKAMQAANAVAGATFPPAAAVSAIASTCAADADRLAATLAVANGNPDGVMLAAYDAAASFSAAAGAAKLAADAADYEYDSLPATGSVDDILAAASVANVAAQARAVSKEAATAAATAAQLADRIANG